MPSLLHMPKRLLVTAKLKQLMTFPVQVLGAVHPQPTVGMQRK